MGRAAIILIVIGILLIIGANWFVSTQPEPEPPPREDRTTLRSTTSGDVVGFRDRYGARAWLGIPYAEPAVEHRRWKAPGEPIPSTEPLVALQPGPMCPQFASLLSGGDPTGNSGVVGDEDCLSLNIWSPPNAVDLPVMFWIHGGGNTIGHGGSYNGSYLAANRDVVVVTINYRLGVFGWFNHPVLHTGDPADDSGNYGTLDIIRALKWVQNNIENFGGDPASVTVFGESAGARNALTMMSSPLARGLFHRAIVQSGGYGPHTADHVQNYLEDGGHPNSSREIVAKLMMEDGTASNRKAAMDYQASMSPIRLREYLYNKPAAEFFRVFEGGGFGMVNVPNIIGDGHVLPTGSPEQVFSNPDLHNMVPVILGTNRDEPAIFMVRDPRYVTNWLGFLPRLKDPDTYSRIVKYGALAWKERGVDSLAEYMRAAGNPHVYAYRFDWDEEPSQAGFDLSTALGAAHGLEIAFAFGEFDGGMNLAYLYPGNENQFALARSMTSYWSEFAYHGNPGQGRNGEEVAWTSWGQDDKHTLILDTRADQGIFMDSGIVTLAAIKAELAADQGFPDPADQCRVYIRNFRQSFAEAEYLALNSQCADIDPASVVGF